MANNTMLNSLRVGAKIASIVPRKWGSRIAYNFGFLYGLYPSKLALRIRKIHRRVSPQLTNTLIRRQAAGVVASYAQYWWDVFWLTSPRSTKEIDRCISIENSQYFHQSIDHITSKNKGVIYALPHLGSWEIAGAWIAGQGYPPTVVAERLQPPELFELFTSTRTRAGMVVVAHDDHPSAKLLAALNNAEIICLVADRDLSRRGVITDFFGAPKSMPTGPAALALKTGALLVPVCTYVSRDAGITLSFSEPIDMAAYTGTKDETIAGATQELTHRFEEMISRDPTQWHVLSDEWEKP